MSVIRDLNDAHVLKDLFLIILALQQNVLSAVTIQLCGILLFINI